MREESIHSLFFSDIEDSTTLLQRVGDRYIDLVKRHRELVRSAIATFSGIERGTEGDSFFVTFTSAVDAVRAAIAVQLLHQAEAWGEGENIRTRIGLHIGEISDIPGGPFGLAIHHAARIMPTAHGGQIVVSDRLCAEASKSGSDFGFRSLGAFQLRNIGLAELFQVTHADLVDGFPPLRAQGQVRTNLPVELSSLVGRDRELQEVGAAVTAGRLVTLIGSGGVGKTRLASAVGSYLAEHFADGVWLVSLHSLSLGQDIIGEIARAMGLASTEALFEAIEDKAVLIILDNCEPVIADAADAVHAMLSRSSSIKVLATSREPLRVSGEFLFRVPTLSTPTSGAHWETVIHHDACRLFWDRALLARPNLDLKEDAANGIREICRALDGLPLAIELAAARAATYEIADIATLIEDRFRFLVSGTRTSTAHQRTLRATVDWSYELLTKEEQDLLSALSIFVGGFDVDAALGVTTGETRDRYAMIDMVASLHDKSLLATDDAAPGRFRLPETIREYCAEVLGPALGHLQLQHALWFADAIGKAGLATQPGAVGRLLDLYELEHANLLAAVGVLTDSDPRRALQTLNWMARANSMCSGSDSLIVPMQRLIARSAELPAAEAAFTHMVLSLDAMLGLIDADYKSYAAAALLLLNTASDAERWGEAESMLEYQRAAETNQPDEHRAAEIIAFADRSGVTITRLWTRDILSKCAADSFGLGLLIDAAAIAEESHEIGLGQYFRLSASFYLSIQGDSSSAVASARAGLVGISSLAKRGRIEIEVAALGALVEGEHGDLRTAIDLAEDLAMIVRSRLHSRRELGAVLAVLARLHHCASNFELAQQNATEAIALFSAEKFSWYVSGLAYTTSSALHRHEGNPDLAARVLAAVASKASTGRSFLILEEAATVALDLCRQTEAANLLATAASLRVAHGRAVRPIDARRLAELGLALTPWPGVCLEWHEAAETIGSLAR